MGRGNTLSRSVGHPVQGRDGALQVPWGCDGRLDATIARASFSNSGFEVEVAQNGAVAEYLLLRHEFDMAVLDLGLPLVDGLTVLQRVRAPRFVKRLARLNALENRDEADDSATMHTED